MAARKQHMQFLGDPFPLVPVSHFVRETVPLKEACQLVGPTIERNSGRSNQDLYCIAFIEGMRMAYYHLRQNADKQESG